MFRKWNGKDIPQGGYSVSQKIDGFRANHYRGIDGTPRLWTKNGHEIHGVGHILHKLGIMESIAGEPMMFDGEFQVNGTLSDTKRWHEKGWKLGGEDGTLFIFDMMPERLWRDGGDPKPWIIRDSELSELLALSEQSDENWQWREGTHGKEPDCPAVKAIEWEILDTVEEIERKAQEMYNRGDEGLVLKVIDSPYIRGRSNDWKKVKQGR